MSYDVLHITSQEYAYLAIILPKKKTVITCHDILPITEERNVVRWNYRLRIRLGVIGMKRVKNVVAISNYTKKQLIKQGIPANNISVVYSGVDRKIYNLKKQKNILKKYNLESPYILHVGSEIARKNVHNVIKAFSIVKESISKLKLCRVGTPQHNTNRDELTLLAKDLKVGKDVHFLNFIPEKDVAELYRRAEVMVFPSFSEGFGWPIVEAMACGCPVVTSDRGAMKETAGNAAYLCNPNDTRSISKSILTVFTNPKLRKTKVLKGVSRAKKFTWENTVDKMQKIYTSIHES